jgi:type II secretory pathway component GspD/PulD (secretin)
MNTYQTSIGFKLTLAGLLLCASSVAVQNLQAQVVNNQAGVSAITPNTQQIETGPVLDVVPYVLSDGYTINLTLIPSLVQFEGYATPPPVQNVTGNLNVVQLPVVLPDFSVRQVVTTVNIWDDQTVVIGGLISSGTVSTKDKVPMLGDLPAVGVLFQSSSKTVAKKNLMIFVTATIVDPAGNRVHSDDELPFAQTAIPTQPVVKGQKFEPVTPQTPAAAGAKP